MGDDPVRILLVDDDEDDYFLTARPAGRHPRQQFPARLVGRPRSRAGGDPPTRIRHAPDRLPARSNGRFVPAARGDQAGLHGSHDPPDRPG